MVGSHLPKTLHPIPRPYPFRFGGEFCAACVSGEGGRRMESFKGVYSKISFFEMFMSGGVLGDFLSFHRAPPNSVRLSQAEQILCHLVNRVDRSGSRAKGTLGHDQLGKFVRQIHVGRFQCGWFDKSGAALSGLTQVFLA